MTTRRRISAARTSHRWVCRLALLGVLSSLLVPQGSWAATPQTSDQLRQQLDQIEAERKRLERDRQKAAAAERQANHRRQNAQQQLQSTAQAVIRAAQEVRNMETRLGTARRQLAEAQQELEHHLRDFADRLDLLYRYGEPSYFDLFLSADDFAEFSDLAYYRQAILAKDAELVHDLERMRDRAVWAYEQVSRYEQQAKEAHGQLSQEKSRLGDLAAQHTAEWQRERVRLQAIDRQLAELEQAQAAMTEEWKRLTQTAEGRARAAQAFTGTFLRPVGGRVSSNFGWRERHPIYGDRRFHAGIDIAAPRGTPIKAAAAGVVVVAGSRSGYGNTVVVDHSGGIATLYAHCDTLRVSPGQSVTQGQIIATVGRTGSATGYHLHWEVRRNGEPVQPPW